MSEDRRIVKRSSVEHRIDYRVGELQDKISHFVVRVTTPENPFVPHQHEGWEFWYIIEGEAVVTLDGQETTVGEGDLMVLPPWTKHGLRTDDRVRWICLG